VKEAAIRGVMVSIISGTMSATPSVTASLIRRFCSAVRVAPVRRRSCSIIAGSMPLIIPTRVAFMFIASL
jgi:hypothetical protein